MMPACVNPPPANKTVETDTSKSNISTIPVKTTKFTKPAKPVPPPVDYDELLRKTAHPKAVKLLKDEFYWSPIEETAPFGSDDGADAFGHFQKWRLTYPKTSPLIFIRGLLDWSWKYEFFNWNEMDSIKIRKLISEKKPKTEAEIQQHILFLKEVYKKASDLGEGELNDAQLRMIVEHKGMLPIYTYIVGQDNVIIATGFGQFVAEGRIDEDLLSLTKIALKRQCMPILLELFRDNYQKERLEQLKKMLAVLNKI